MRVLSSTCTRLVIAGFDANVTLPQDISQRTGSCTLRTLPSHKTPMQDDILSWMAQFDLRAINTFGVDDSRHLLGTCGWKRPLMDRSQINFVAISSSISGSSYAARELDIRDNAALHKGMDHRPVLARLVLPGEAVRPTVTPPNATLKGWAPDTAKAREEFLHKVSIHSFVNSLSLLNIERKIAHVATDIDYTTSYLIAST